MAKKEKRFIELYQQDFGNIRLLVDRETGIQYLSVYNGGTTVLLDTDGRPLFASASEIAELGD